ncbi:hypothetical protein J2Y41_004652 [Arthrobacter sp. 1088]|uniref:hypothetical protein n=1 Tax=Arthrobacter sp. 1088 TaxID=2817768 RepID=UPI00286363A1|nr:hypothetical protein [Arthrobacter sp. 1088]MDR6689048.1 hypothetical protein [Arthrobacter sp. 1088]
MGQVEQFEDRLLKEFPTSVFRSGKTILIKFHIVDQVLKLAQSADLRLAGMDGFEEIGESIVPMMAYIVDLSSMIAAGSPIAQQYDATRAFISDNAEEPDLIELVLLAP